MKIFLVILVMLVGLYGDDYEHHNERHINKELSHLHLSKQQNTKIKKILKQFRDDLKDFREYKEDIQKKRERLFVQNELDIEAINKLNAMLDEQSHKIENRLLLKIHTILSKKQRKKFIRYFDDWEVK